MRWECQKISLGLLGQANFVVHSYSSATMSFNGRTRPADSSSSPLLTLVGSRPGAEMGWPEASKILPDSSTCTGRVVDLSFLVDRDRITRTSGGIVDCGRRTREQLLHCAGCVKNIKSNAGLLPALPMSMPADRSCINTFFLFASWWAMQKRMHKIGMLFSSEIPVRSSGSPCPSDKKQRAYKELKAPPPLEDLPWCRDPPDRKSLQ